MLQLIDENDIFKLYKSDMIFRDRDFVVLRFKKDDSIQPFYRSFGRNSGKPGTWFPFDGIVWIGRLWFNKERFRTKDDLSRYGTARHKKILDYLAQMELAKGDNYIAYEDYELVNQELGTHKSFLTDFELNEEIEKTCLKK
jgi:hypothetical protein